jgi:hypothetical protein
MTQSTPTFDESRRAGWFRTLSTGKRIYGFTAKSLRKAANGHDLQTVVEALDKAGALVKIEKTKVPDGSFIKLFWVDPEKL